MVSVNTFSINYRDNILDVNDQHELQIIPQKLDLLQEFSDKEYYSEKVQNTIIQKLELHNPYWLKFKNELSFMIKHRSFVIVKGLPFDVNNRLLVGLCSLLGNLFEPYKTSDAHMVRNQTPGEVVYDQDVFPHTDGAHWPLPNDLTILECFKKDQNGEGLSEIVPISQILEFCKNEGMIELLNDLATTKFPFKLHKSFQMGDVHFQTVLSALGNGKNTELHVRFAARYTEEAIEKSGKDLAPNSLNNIYEFEKIASELGSKNQFALDEGDLLIYDNKRVLHGRSEVTLQSERIIKKVKVNINRKTFFN